VRVLFFVSLASLAGCSSLGASAVRTGPMVLPAYAGPVAIYASGQAPAGQELGVVDVQGMESEATVQTLLPLFVQKAAQIGGNAAVLDRVDANFETYWVPHLETYAVPCGFRGTCFRSRMYNTSSEVMTVHLRGRAFRTGPGVAAAESAPAMGTEAP
jgi:hypothetical protein